MVFDLHNSDECTIVSAGLKGKRIGITSGCYDLLHYQHLSYLQRCRRRCDVLIVGIDADHMVQEIKGTERPMIPENQRAFMVDALKCVDGVFIMGTLDDFLRAIKVLGVSMIFKNQVFEDTSTVIGHEYANVVIVPDLPQQDSTTAIIEEIIQRRTNGSAPQVTPMLT